MVIREIKKSERNELLDLYTHLHETGIPEQNEALSAAWASILNDPNHHVIVAEEDGRLVSSVVCVIIPNLTRNARPYAFIENVVTRREYRSRGYATACLNVAREIAQKENCYKMMLLTGSKNDRTMRFYQNAGYNSVDKTAFIQWLE